MLATITVLGVPKQIKTDNGPCYTSSSFFQFSEKLTMLHKTGILYNPQGQSMVERAHQTIKHHFEKKGGGMVPYQGIPQKFPSSHTRYFNFLNFRF